ncbi:MAG: hypothetical protein AAB624_03990, partial [Patescibacteria group bacterium]
MKKLKLFLVSVLAMFSFSPALMPAVASAASSADNLACGVSGDIAGTTNCDASDTVDADNRINGIIAAAIRIFQVVVGLISIIMIIMGGLKYITSGGDAASVGSAKNTILYALVGIVVVALAEIIVQFVLNRASNAGTG